MGWHCQMCGDEHDNLPLSYGAEAPWRSFVPEDEFQTRVDLNDSFCVIDRQFFYVRAHLQLPIHDHDEPFAWSVWGSVSRESFARMLQLLNKAERVEADPYFAWLGTGLPFYEPTTIELKTLLYEREPGQIPLMELEPTDHPLAIEQREGIPIERVMHFAHVLLGHERG